MIHHDEAPLDPAQEDRTVEYLRSHGVFGVPSAVTPIHIADSPRRTSGRWRAPLIAAAAVLLFAFISVLASRKPRPATYDMPQASSPRLLVWY
jgi:hypothetical protein